MKIMLWIEFILNLKLNETEGQLLLPPFSTWLEFQIISPIPHVELYHDEQY